MKKIMALVNEDAPEHIALDVANAQVTNETESIDVVAAIRPISPMFHTVWPKHSREIEDERLNGVQSIVQRIVSERSDWNAPVDAVVLQGKPFVEIIRYAQENGHELIVTDESVDFSESAERPREDTNLRLLRKCPCPVWLAKSDCPPRPRRVVAAVDVETDASQGQDLNAKIISQAIAVASKSGAKVIVLHAWELIGESTILRKYGVEEFDRVRAAYVAKVESAAATLLEPFGDSRVTFQLLNGPPALAIPKFAQEETIDLVVMGTVARSGVAGLLMGNTAERIVESADCSLLALKPDDFQSQIK